MRQSDRTRKLLAMLGSNTRGTKVGIVTIIGDKPRDHEPLISQRARKALVDFLGES